MEAEGVCGPSEEGEEFSSSLQICQYLVQVKEPSIYRKYCSAQEISLSRWPPLLDSKLSEPPSSSRKVEPPRFF